MDGGWYIGGAETEAFETEWATYCGAAHAVGVANGLDALVLSLRALNIGEGDEVIVPSHTFVATWLAVSSVGAKPVPVEPNPLSYNIDPARIVAGITPRTRAIIPVHLYGQPADLDPILDIAKSHGLSVIEDAAQAHGARYKGRRIGGHGDIVCWSFYPGKNLGAFGDGGGITTNRADLADKIRMLGNYGSREKYVHELAGTNSRLDPIQAAVLRVKLHHLDNWTDKRKALAAEYSMVLKNGGLILPQQAGYAEHVWHLYVVRSPERTRVMKVLADAGIGSQIHYPIPPHMQTAYASLGHAPSDFPLTQKISSEVFSLPMGPQTPPATAAAIRAALHQRLTLHV